MDQRNRIKSPEINPWITANQFSTKVPGTHNREKDNLLNKWGWGGWVYVYAED